MQVRSALVLFLGGLAGGSIVNDASWERAGTLLGEILAWIEVPSHCI